MLTADEWPGNVTLVSYARECVAELLRQHAENETLRVGYAAARLEVESLKAQLHAANAGGPRNAIARAALIDAIAQGLRGTWHCTRAWEAWHVGTMSQDDFEPVDESETPTEIADAVLALLAAALTPAIGGLYNWKGQPERLVYMGARRYLGDPRPWHRFAKVEAPHVCWTEVLTSELAMLEETKGTK